MKTKRAIYFMLIVAVFWGGFSAIAQGILVQKKDGTVINVPYTELDSISTYNEKDSIKTFNVNGAKFNMVFVEGGTFEMGATPEQSNGFTPEENEYPVHSVTLSDYYIGQTEVTQKLWFAVMDERPFYPDSWYSDCGLGERFPAYSISYSECQEFIKKLNDITGVKFRMPTEAEWEYAARGGNQSKGYIFSGSNNVEEVAWYVGNSNSLTHEVGTKAPNELGIYDMSGNVWEWCSDWYDIYRSGSQTNPTGPSTGYLRVKRGGGYNYSVNYFRVANRTPDSPEIHFTDLGLRLVLDLQPQK